jgi:hypothetical protein
MKVTALFAGNTRLSKKFTKAGVESYPNVKKMTSQVFDISVRKDLSEFEKVIREVSERGGCLLKGPLTKELDAESRAGHTDRHALAEYMVLDFDGIVLPDFSLPIGQKLSEKTMYIIAEEVIKILPEEFHGTSYIIQASSSLGQKGSRLSFHLFFTLSTPLEPRVLKDYIKNLNFQIPLLDKAIDLTATGFALTWPLDPSVADNSKIIFVADPVFDGAEDPFDDPEFRIVRHDYEKTSVDLAAAVDAMPNAEQLLKKIDAKRRALRIQKGMPVRKAIYKTRTFGGERHEVLDNPERVKISVVDDTHMPFVRCNINGGDSGAYFFNIHSPKYMGNFKGEPYFCMEEADPEFYESIFEIYKDQIKQFRVDPAPVVFRDFFTDCIYNGVYNPKTNMFTEDYPLTATSRASVQGFMEGHGHDAPDVIPEARLVFDPTDDNPSINLDVKPYYINMYQKTPYQLKPAASGSYEYANGEKGLEETCPAIHMLMKHALGNSNEDLRHFVNWLAFIYQNRQKTGVAWVLGGVQGTGKGLLLNRVLRPLFGAQHVPVRTLENIEEQYNSYMQTALILGVDEFRMFNSKGGLLRVADKLKNQITEPTVTIRAMHQNQIEVPSYTNFIFLTNRPDAIKIEESDRRYCIASRQTTKIADAHPDLIKNIKAIDRELFLLAGFLGEFQVDVLQATKALENVAKQTMKEVSMTLPEEFCAAITYGDLDFFHEILDFDTSDTFNAGRIVASQIIVRDWIKRALLGYDCALKPTDLLQIYTLIMTEGRVMALKEFTKLLARNGLEVKVCRVFKDAESTQRSQVRGIHVIWRTSPERLQELYDQYVAPVERKKIV